MLVKTLKIEPVGFPIELKTLKLTGQLSNAEHKFSGDFAHGGMIVALKEISIHDTEAGSPDQLTI